MTTESLARMFDRPRRDGKAWTNVIPSPYLPGEPLAIVCVYGSEACLMSDLYRTVKALQAIKRATTIDGIREALRGPAAKAKADGDTELLGLLVGAATKRKAQLEAA
jgi:hypothetical protein